jgi:hypothetical protein
MPIIHDKKIYDSLRAADIDHLLAQHVAHLFIRDTVSLFSEKVNQPVTDSDHFEVYLTHCPNFLIKQIELNINVLNLF